MPGRKLTGKIAPDRIRLMEVPRPPNGIIEGYRGLGHASGILSDIMDELGITGVIAASVLKPTMPGACIVGPALTVRNIAQREHAYESARKHVNRMAEFEAHNLALPGDVVVIDGVAGTSNMGGISAQTGKRQGEAGAIVSGIALVASAPNVLVVHPSIPVRSVQELVEYARAHPGTLAYGSAGVGTVSHLAGTLVAEMAHVQFVHVPYKGTAAAQVDLLSGRLQFMFDSMVSAMANAKAGKVKALAVTSPERWQSAPELPPMAESGFPGFNMTAWFGLLAPAGTPAPIVARISEVLSAGLQRIEVRERIAAIGGEPGRMTPAEFGQYIHAENTRWKRLFADGLIRIED